MKLIIPIILLSVIMIAGCLEGEDVEPRDNNVGHRRYYFNNDLAKVYYEYGQLYYFLGVEKPTPCHKAVVNPIISESYPVIVDLDVKTIPPEDGVFCAEMLENETLSGRINLSEPPGDVKIEFRELY